MRLRISSELASRENLIFSRAKIACFDLAKKFPSYIFIVYSAFYLVACFLQESLQKLVELVRLDVAIPWNKERRRTRVCVFLRQKVIKTRFKLPQLR